jgi:hypothetical protein
MDEDVVVRPNRCIGVNPQVGIRGMGADGFDIDSLPVVSEINATIAIFVHVGVETVLDPE